MLKLVQRQLFAGVLPEEYYYLLDRCAPADLLHGGKFHSHHSGFILKGGWIVINKGSDAQCNCLTDLFLVPVTLPEGRKLLEARVVVDFCEDKPFLDLFTNGASLVKSAKIARFTGEIPEAGLEICRRRIGFGEEVWASAESGASLMATRGKYLSSVTSNGMVAAHSLSCHVFHGHCGQPAFDAAGAVFGIGANTEFTHIGEQFEDIDFNFRKAWGFGRVIDLGALIDRAVLHLGMRPQN